MEGSIPESYRVADFVSWDRERRLRLNPDFQRGPVWTPDPRSYLIETILRRFPMPKIYMRTVIDTNAQLTHRDIVDGQQRMRAILDFANDRFRLGRRGGEWSGLKYADLDSDDKSEFLSYSISVEQLIDASNDDVLEVFARLNTYTVPLNAPEKRHAKYQGEFKFAVRRAAQSLRWFWERYGILSTRNQVRMLDQQLVAELFGLFADGVVDGGAVYLDRLYDRFDADMQGLTDVGERTESVIQLIDEHFGDLLRAGFFSRAPQFLILFSAVTHSAYGLPAGALADGMPPRVSLEAINWESAQFQLLALGEAAVEDPPPQPYATFASAAGGATTRIASRRTRFLAVWDAFAVAA